DDERLDMVTITSIDVDPEMNRAIVYFDSLLGEDGDAEILSALASHRVRLQSFVGREVRAKKTPILSFRPDETIRAAERIERILHDNATMPERPAQPADDEADADGDGQSQAADNSWSGGGRQAGRGHQSRRRRDVAQAVRRTPGRPCRHVGP